MSTKEIYLQPISMALRGGHKGVAERGKETNTRFFFFRSPA